MYEEKDNSGSLFRNQKNNPNQPDYRGHAMVNGRPMEIAAWVRAKQSNGEKWLSIAFSEPRQRQEAPAGQQGYAAPQAPAAPRQNFAPQPPVAPAFAPQAAQEQGGDDLPF